MIKPQLLGILLGINIGSRLKSLFPQVLAHLPKQAFFIYKMLSCHLLFSYVLSYAVHKKVFPFELHSSHSYMELFF